MAQKVDTSFVGVDIGSTAVRAARLGGVSADGFVTVEQFGIAPLKPDMVRSGKVRNIAAVGQAVRKAVADAGGRRRPVVIGATATEAAVSRLNVQAEVPPADRLRVIRTLGMQVTPTIPANEAEMAASFIRTDTTGDDRRVATLSVAAIPSQELETLRSVAEAANVDLQGIDLAAAGTLRALVRDLPGSRDVATVVDIGATRTTVVTREGLILRSVRAFPSGGLDLTKALMNATREDFAAAEQRKYSLRLPTTGGAGPVAENTTYGGLDPDEEEEYLSRLADHTTAEQALAMAAEILIDLIAQAIETDNDNLGRTTRHIALCGGTALTRGLKERLQRRLGVEVRIGHPWARLAAHRRNEKFFVGGEGASLREDPRLMLTLATATGLALRPEVAPK